MFLVWGKRIHFVVYLLICASFGWDRQADSSTVYLANWVLCSSFTVRGTASPITAQPWPGGISVRPINGRDGSLLMSHCCCFFS